MQVSTSSLPQNLYGLTAARPECECGGGRSQNLYRRISKNLAGSDAQSSSSWAFWVHTFHVCFDKIFPTSELLARQSIWTSTALSTLLKKFPSLVRSCLALAHIFLWFETVGHFKTTRFPLQRMTSTPSLQVLFDERTAQVDASSHKHSLLNNLPLHKRRMSAGYLYSEGLFPRNFLVESCSVANPHLFQSFLDSSLDRVSFHTSLLESTDLLLSTVRNLHCFCFLCTLTYH